MNITFTQVILTIIAVALSIIAIKITFSFDINKYLEGKKEDIKNQIKNHCTHMYVKDIDWNIGLQSSFISPSGTNNYICQRCWLWRYHLDGNEERTRMEGLIKNPEEYKKQEKRFEKLLKKWWFL